MSNLIFIFSKILPDYQHFRFVGWKEVDLSVTLKQMYLLKSCPNFSSEGIQRITVQTKLKMKDL